MLRPDALSIRVCSRHSPVSPQAATIVTSTVKAGSEAVLPICAKTLTEFTAALPRVYARTPGSFVDPLRAPG